MGVVESMKDSTEDKKFRDKKVSFGKAEVTVDLGLGF